MTRRRPPITLDEDLEPPERVSVRGGPHQAAMAPGADPAGPPGSSWADDTPDIAPPVLLEPIPEPTILEAPGAASVGEDPYAWAASAAMSMEAEGRSFDEVGPFHEERATAYVEDVTPFDRMGNTDDDAVAPPSPDRWRAPEAMAEWLAEEEEAGRTGQHRAVGTRDRPATTPPAPSNPVPLLLALAILFLVAGLVVGWLAIRQSNTPEPLLRPVEITEAPTGPRRFALPATESAKPPGSSVDGALPLPEGVPMGPVTRLEILTRPPGAAVKLNGKELGTTPFLSDQRSGTHRVALSLEGYTTEERVIRAQGERTELVVDLVPESAEGLFLVVAQGWEGASLWVDGRPTATLPARVRLPGGTHDFTVEIGGQRAEIRKVLVPSTQGVVTVDLAEP